MERSEQVLAVDRALDAAAIPHAFGGALALAYYGRPRPTIDTDVNVFVPVECEREVRAALAPLGDAPVHLFFSDDALHEEMPTAVRRVPFVGTTIPIVSPEHLIIRKALLDRPKDWPDIEAILTATAPLDIAEIITWVRRLAGEKDPHVTKLRDTARRLLT